MSDDTNMRDEFEAWHIARQRSRGYGTMLTDAEFVGRHTNGRYSTLGLEYAWNAWQAAWNRRTDTRAADVSTSAPNLDTLAQRVQEARVSALEEAARYLDGLHAQANGRHNYHQFAANGVRALAAKTTEG